MSKRAPKKPAAAKLLTRREIASLLGVHVMTVTKWEQDGMPVASRGGKGRPSHYREVDVRAWLQMRQEAAQRPEAVSVAQSRARRELAQAALAEQALKIRNRDLLPREEVERAWAAEVQAVRTRLLLWPTTLADQVHRIAVTQGAAGVEEFLVQQVHTVLRELSS